MSHFRLPECVPMAEQNGRTAAVVRKSRPRGEMTTASNTGSHLHRGSVYGLRHIMVAIGALLIGGLLMASSTGAKTPGFELRVSGSASRSPSNPLAHSTLQGNAYVYTTPVSGVKRVSFYIDDAKMTRAPF